MLCVLERDETNKYEVNMNKSTKGILQFFLLLTVSIQGIFSFPGDHNSLTCDKNFEGIPLSPPIIENPLGKIHSTIDEFILSNYIRKDSRTLALPITDCLPETMFCDANAVENRKNIIAAIKADLAKPYPDSIVKKNIRDKIETSYEGKEVHITKWGDSLSDFVQFYGIMGPAYPYFPQYGQQGYYGGSIPFVDSWSDYFSIFGKPNYTPVFVKNYGYATYTTTQVLDKMGVSLENTDVNWWDSRVTDNHCIKEVTEDWFIPIWPKHVFNGKSQLYSTLMIGGNDVLNASLKGTVLFPFLSSQLVNHTVDNISFMVDWHIENGKKVLLEGTIPIISKSIKPYNSLVVSRQAICRPLDETFIPPQKIPWWLCALGPGYCAQLAKATKDYYETIAKEFKKFGENLVEQIPDSGPNYTALNTYLDNPIGAPGAGANWFVEELENTVFNFITVDVLNGGQATPADGGESKLDSPLLRMGSITQACINDRIAQDIGPSYKSTFPNNVDYEPLYDHFNTKGNDPFAQSFWVPKSGIYRKYMGQLTTPDKDAGFPFFQDFEHIGPAGYQLWGQIIGTKLKALGWNKVPSNSDYPDPVIELDNDGPGKKIKKKAITIGWNGKETSLTKMISKKVTGVRDGAGTYGGYYRQYRGGIIYLQQINDLATSSNGSKFGEPFSVSGLLLDRYIQEGGPAGNLGFPTTDPYMVHFNSIDRAGFQCGYIDHNQMNILDPTNTSVTITSAACAANNSKLF